MAAAVRFVQHGFPHSDFMAWLGHYRAYTPGVVTADNTTVRLDADNEFQPDALMMIEPQSGGQAKYSDDGYIEGPPELAAEVSSSTVSMDLNTKLRVYRRNGVREYLVWRVLDRAIDWFVLEEGEYRPLPPTADGLLKSRVFPGLWLDPVAFLNRDGKRLMSVLRQGLATPEHAAFVSKLAAKKA